jgi:hypothetical protein
MLIIMLTPTFYIYIILEDFMVKKVMILSKMEANILQNHLTTIQGPAWNFC